MYYAIEALTYLFDMVIIIIYMNGIFHKENRRTAYPLYIACFLIMEVLIYVNQTLCTGLPSKQFTIATNMVSLLTTFALTFLYRTRLSNRIFVSISFQLLALLGESFFLFLVKIINPAVIELPLRQLSILMNLGSKIMLFLLILVVIFYWNRHIKYHDYKYNLLLFTTPVLSLVITLCIPVRSNYQSNNAYYMIIAYFAIALLNILNYCLLDNCFKMEQIKDENLSMRRQIDFQQEKYFQLGTAYKKTRSIVHDMKNHCNLRDAQATTDGAVRCISSLCDQRHRSELYQCQQRQPCIGCLHQQLRDARKREAICLFPKDYIATNSDSGLGL